MYMLSVKVSSYLNKNRNQFSMIPISASGVVITTALVILNLSPTLGQELDGPQFERNGICTSYDSQNVKELAKCVVFVGNLVISTEHRPTRDYNNLTFPNLREVTGYIALYRVFKLYSLSQVFPNLALIRGQQLLRNYALGVHGLRDLTEIGLYSLVRIERGGVLVWACPKACFVQTIDWDSIAPRGRQVLAQSPNSCEGPSACRCMNYPDIDYCWNRRKCQRLLTGPVADICHEECLGCRKTDHNKCLRCAHFTDGNMCVPKCPDGKIVLPQSFHCLTKQECYQMFNGKGFIANNTCLEHCPKGYDLVPSKEPSENGTCVECTSCNKTRVCNELNVTSLFEAEILSTCTHINGSLKIKVHSSFHSMVDLKRYLGSIQYIKDYLMITHSVGITSLDILGNLKIIAGKNLFLNKYSIVIREMKNLRKLFPENQAKMLQIENGTILAYNNPRLCMLEIENFHMHISMPMGQKSEISPTSNGNFGQCYNIEIPLNVSATGQRSAIAFFQRIHPQRNVKLTFNYSIHYAEVSPGSDYERVPLYCNNRSWETAHISSKKSEQETWSTNTLKPATTYVLYVEAYQDSSIMLHNQNLTDIGRSKLQIFQTGVGVPPPPFIYAITALSPYSFAVHWLDHVKYSANITRYLFDVSVINYNKTGIDSKNQCLESFTLSKRPSDDYRHVIIRNPPPEYGELCVCQNKVKYRQNSSMHFKRFRLKWLHSLTPIMSSDSFDVCDLPDIDCGESWEEQLLENKTSDGVIQSLGVEILPKKKEYVVTRLRPFHDYRVRLRACTGPSETDCGRSAREIIRTQMIRGNDIVRLHNVSLKSSEFYLSWDPPIAPNGYALAFIVQLKFMSSEIHEKCISSVQHEQNGRRFYFKLKDKTEEYSVRVCTSSMAEDRICGDWNSRYERSSYGWLVVLSIGLLIGAGGTAPLVRWWRMQRPRGDRERLIESFQLLPNFSEPPTLEEL